MIVIKIVIFLKSLQESSFPSHHLSTRYQLLTPDTTHQQSQFYHQPRFVQIVNPIPTQQNVPPSTATLLAGQLRTGMTTVPVQYHNEGGTQVLQAFPVSIIKSGMKSVVSRTVQVIFTIS